MQPIRTVTDRISSLKDTVNMTDRVIAPTKLIRDLLIRNGVNPRLIQLSHYGVNTSDILSGPRSPAWPDELRIGYIGEISPHKGVDILVKAFNGLTRIRNASKESTNMRPARLKIYGDEKRFPEYSAQLRKLAEESKYISFMGPFEEEKVGWVLSEVDVLVVPSIWYENGPLEIYFAFASGTPVVATNLGGISEIIEHGRNGLLFRRNDFRHLTNQLLHLLIDWELLPQLRKSIKPVKTAKESVDELEALYAELLSPDKYAVQAG
jgi:glycosyltransferase involved in cell wall biosynthesis